MMAAHGQRGKDRAQMQGGKSRRASVKYLSIVRSMGHGG
jgi:hypothetical protein